MKEVIQSRRNFKLVPPRLWLKCWVLLLKAARKGGDAPRSRRPERRRLQPPLGSGRIPTTARQRSPAAKHGRAGARTACTRHVFHARTRRAHGASCAHTQRVSRRAERRVSRRAERRVSRRAERRVSRRAEPRIFRRAEQRGSRHENGASTDAQTSASSGAQTARVSGVRSVAF